MSYNTVVVDIDTTRIRDWDSFHAVFAETLGFPDLYGRNMDAWIDCMTCLNDPDTGMTRLHVPVGSIVTLKLHGITEFAARCPEQYEALIECASFVNWRLIESGHEPVLALAFYKSVSKAR
jgi:hypothetical protein